MAEPQVKPEPDAGSPFMDETDEAPDLEFYDKLPPQLADAYSRMYLTRVPNYVWEAWSKLNDDEEIEIGTIRQWMDENGKMVSSSPPSNMPRGLLTRATEIANAPQTRIGGSQGGSKGVRDGSHQPRRQQHLHLHRTRLAELRGQEQGEGRCTGPGHPGSSTSEAAATAGTSS
jgi:hypothetical protein